MGISTSKSQEVLEKEKEIKVEIEEWISLRNETIKELNRVADELDSLHKKATYSKIAGGFAGAVGGAVALGGLVMAFVTGGTSLAITGAGISLAASGGVAATAAEVVEYLKKRTRVNTAQKALEDDRKRQNELLEKIEATIDKSDIDQEQKNRARVSLKSVVDGIKKMWSSGIYLYGWAKSGQAIYSTVKWVQAGNSVWKLGASKAIQRAVLSVSGGLAGSVFMLIDLSYVIHHAIEIKRGSPSEAAKSMREVTVMLTEERDRIVAIIRQH